MVSFLAGRPLTAAELNQAVMTGRSAAASGSTTVTTSVADVAGATFTVTTIADNQVAMVTGIFDVTNGGNDAFVGVLNVGGSAQDGQAISVGADRKTVAQAWIVSLPTAGSYTFKLQTYKVGSTATVTLNSTHTRIVGLISGVSS